MLSSILPDTFVLPDLFFFSMFPPLLEMAHPPGPYFLSLLNVFLLNVAQIYLIWFFWNQNYDTFWTNFISHHGHMWTSSTIILRPIIHSIAGHNTHFWAKWIIFCDILINYILSNGKIQEKKSTGRGEQKLSENLMFFPR